jgi:hypothetical protein
MRDDPAAAGGDGGPLAAILKELPGKVASCCTHIVPGCLPDAALPGAGSQAAADGHGSGKAEKVGRGRGRRWIADWDWLLGVSLSLGKGSLEHVLLYSSSSLSKVLVKESRSKSELPGYTLVSVSGVVLLLLQPTCRCCRHEQPGRL